jgi:hypothetical protein
VGGGGVVGVLQTDHLDLLGLVLLEFLRLLWRKGLAQRIVQEPVVDTRRHVFVVVALVELVEREDQRPLSSTIFPSLFDAMVQVSSFSVFLISYPVAISCLSSALFSSSGAA